MASLLNSKRSFPLQSALPLSRPQRVHSIDGKLRKRIVNNDDNLIDNELILQRQGQTTTLSMLSVVPGHGDVVALSIKSTARILHKSDCIKALNRVDLPELAQPTM